MSAFEEIQEASLATRERLAEAEAQVANCGYVVASAGPHVSHSDMNALRAAESERDAVLEEARFEAWCKRYLRRIYEAEKKTANAAAVGGVR